MVLTKSVNILKLWRTGFIQNSGISSKMDKPKVLITRCDIAPTVLDTLKSKCDLTMWNEKSAAPRDFLMKNISGKKGLFCFLTDKVDKELLDIAGENLKVVSTFSVGYDHIDINECHRRNIKIGYTPDVLTEATAELTVGLLLCTSRRLIEANKEVYNGGWKTWSPSWIIGPGLSGSTVGIVGFGRIGQSVALKLKAFNAKHIIYSSRSEKTTEAFITGAIRVSFDELLSRSDFVLCCAALTDDTRNMFDNVAFRKMKKTAIFINTSRGGLVDQNALVEALQNNVIRAAGLDVTTPEPLPLDDPLIKLPNCVIFPHIGSASIETRIAMAQLAADNLITALEGNLMPAELKFN